MYWPDTIDNQVFLSMFKRILNLTLLFAISAICMVQPVFCEPDELAEAAVKEKTQEVRTLPALEEMITSPFGLRNSHRRWQGMGLRRLEHRGVDIKALKGWPVVAFKAGEVIQAGPAGPAGILAKIKQEDGVTTAYAHLDSIIVKKGQKVAKGEVLGVAGCTGRTTGSHLHLSMRKENGEFFNPLLHIKSAYDVLNPSPEQIPAKIASEACARSFFYRGYRGRSFSIQQLRALETSAPPPIPVWPGR